LATNDASGLAIEDGATELRLPAFFEVVDPDPRDWRKNEGDLLWPERFRVEAIKKIRSQLGARQFNSQYQCRPSLAEGNFIKESDIQRYIDLPRDVAPVRTIISGDLAFTGTETSDYTVFQVWHEYPSGCFYLAIQRRGQWAFGRAKVELEKLANEYPKAQIYLEKAANASATADSLAGVLGSRLELIKAIASKDNRVAAVAPLFEAHRVFVPSWMNMKAWTEFPACRFDDEPDCGALALSILSSPDPKAAQRAKNLKGWAAWGDPQVQERYRQLYGALGRVR
jgi:predicted phage terminase large subunit-like protein